MSEFVFYMVVLASWSVLFTQYLTSPGMIFYKPIQWLDYTLFPLSNKKYALEWIREPLWGCYICHAGQVSLWIYLLLFDTWQPFEHFAFVVGTMMIAILLNKATE